MGLDTVFKKETFQLKSPENPEVNRTDKKSSTFHILTASTNLPAFLKNLFAKGAQEPLDFRVKLDDKPHWLDTIKFEKGQKFARDNLLSIGFSEILAIFMVWSLQPVIFPFIFAGNMNTPFQAFKRYLSTFLRINSWYEGDVWSKEMNVARKNLDVTRAYHKNFHLKVQSSTPEEVMEKISLTKEINPTFKFLAKEMSNEFKTNCPALSKVDNLKLGINQMNMSLMQFTLAGLLVTYPKWFGLYYATDEELDSYVHMWRGLGYLLGIKDEYNYCNCEVNTLKKRTRDLIDLVIKPSFTGLFNQWEYSMRCTIDGVHMMVPTEFKVFLRYLFQLLKMESLHLTERMNLYEHLKYFLFQFAFGFLMRIPYLPKILSKILLYSWRKSQRIQPKILTEMKAKSFSYVAKEK